jgi:3-hydroxybutyrate dehydrogenase
LLINFCQAFGHPGRQKGEKFTSWTSKETVMEVKEPAIRKEEILILDDASFSPDFVCIVSGAGTGIGRAAAVAAAANGLTTVGLDINAEQGQRTREMAREMGGNMVFLETDLTQDAHIERAVAEAAKLGAIRYLINIAGIQHIDSVQNFPMEIYDRMQRIMLRAPFYLSKLTIPWMQKNPDGIGVIGNMASVHAHICTVNKPVYNITKFGLRALSQSISAEGQGRIRSFTVSTNFVKTPLALNQIGAQAKQRGMTPEAVVKNVMMGRSQFIFGCSRFAAYLFGGDLLFDGGAVLTY